MLRGLGPLGTTAEQLQLSSTCLAALAVCSHPFSLPSPELGIAVSEQCTCMPHHVPCRAQRATGCA